MSHDQPLYGTQRWRRLAKRQIAAHPLCAFCLERGMVTRATVCDHIDPHRGDEDAFWNGPFQSLCKPHHDGEKQSVEKGGIVKQSIGPDGWPE